MKTAFSQSGSKTLKSCERYVKPEMVYVAICDDEKQIGADLEHALIDIFAEQKVKTEIDVYYSGEELCRKIESGAYFDLIFLDIEFAKHEINGVEVGRLIREAHDNNMVAIVYISWEKKYAMELFAIRPMDFLVKPLEHGTVQRVVKTYLKIAKLWEGEFVYKNGHDRIKVLIKDIIYLESGGRKVVIHLADGSTNEFYGSIKTAYEEQLKNFDFLYIHASYVVNYSYVTKIKYTQLSIKNRITPMTISQYKREEVRAAYLEILKKRGT
jgi:DNA-binding LytR/AlgR family response regulator